MISATCFGSFWNSAVLQAANHLARQLRSVALSMHALRRPLGLLAEEFSRPASSICMVNESRQFGSERGEEGGAVLTVGAAAVSVRAVVGCAVRRRHSSSSTLPSAGSAYGGGSSSGGSTECSANRALERSCAR